MADPCIAAQARQTLAELANAARSGPVGPLTILAYVARLQRHLVTLAEYEETLDRLADEDREAEATRRAAIRTGAALPFPERPGLHAGGHHPGGRAA